MFSYFVRNDMKFVMNETGVLARDNFSLLNLKSISEVLFALLNNYYTYYQLELSGKNTEQDCLNCRGMILRIVLSKL